jgi:transposase-like protein
MYQLRELQEMLVERGVSVDHTTIYRWVQSFTPKMEKRLRCTGVPLPLSVCGALMKRM